MRQFLFLAAAISLGVHFPAYAETVSDEQLREIEAMGFNGVDFATTRPEFLRMFSLVKQVDDEDARAGASTFSMYDPTKRADLISLRFVGDYLYEIVFYYKDSGIAKYGGEPALLNRALQRLGPPVEVFEQGAFWNFPSIDREASVFRDKLSWSLALKRTSVGRKLDSNRARLDAGF